MQRKWCFLKGKKLQKHYIKLHFLEYLSLEYASFHDCVSNCSQRRFLPDSISGPYNYESVTIFSRNITCVWQRRWNLWVSALDRAPSFFGNNTGGRIYPLSKNNGCHSVASIQIIAKNITLSPGSSGFISGYI